MSRRGAAKLGSPSPTSHPTAQLSEKDDGYFVLADGPQDNRALARQPTSKELASIEKSRKLNITLMMYFTFTGTIVFSIIQWNIFDAYLSFLAKSLGMQYINSTVGVAESIAGLTSLVLAVPVGLLVDNFSRTLTLKATAFLGVLASIISFFGFYYDAIIPLYANLFLWGVYLQTSSSASEAIFADSIPTGNRSKYFSDKGVLERLALSLGPGIMILLFYIAGDNWTLRELHVPLLIGCVVAPIPCFILLFFRDPHPDVAFPESIASPFAGSPPPNKVTQRILAASPMTVREQLTCASPTMPYTGEDTLSECDMTEDAWFNNMSWKESAIPYIVALSDFIRKVGAGMTIKFFPLFFIYDYGFRPIHINILFCIYPIGMGIATMVLQMVSGPMGRAQSALIFQLSGIFFLVGMYYLENIWLMVIFFVLRGSFQNASYPLDKSIIMDYVPSSRRGMWNAVESITSMTWSGSAVLGGLLADFHDYRYTFLLTATIYLFASAIYVPLLWLVPKNEKALLKQRRKMAVRRKVVPNAPSDFTVKDDIPSASTRTDEDDSSPVVVVLKADEDLSEDGLDSGGSQLLTPSEKDQMDTYKVH